VAQSPLALVLSTLFKVNGGILDGKQGEMKIVHLDLSPEANDTPLLGVHHPSS
jgi:hypothetical protein